MGDCDFIVRDTEPRPTGGRPRGSPDTLLGPETEYYFAGVTVTRFSRIQFSALTNRLKASDLAAAAAAQPSSSSSSGAAGASSSSSSTAAPASGVSTTASSVQQPASAAAPCTAAAAVRYNSSVQMDDEENPDDWSTERIFKEYVQPCFEPHSRKEKEGGVLRILSVNETVRIKGVTFVVTATDPPGLHGIVDKRTLIYVDKDSTPEYKRVHIVPFQDTLPRSYSFDVFRDYLKPFCERHAAMRFRVNDLFTYNGVQFKVVCVDPAEAGNAGSVGGRIGRNTVIFCEGVLHPQLRDLLPPELVAQLAYLPPGLQMLLLSTDAVGGNQQIFERLVEVQDMLQTRRGMSEETIDAVTTEVLGPKEEREQQENAQMTCMVCLCDFETGDEVKRLPCNHTFHSACVSEWLRRSCECPICKLNVDRHIRQY